MHTQHPAPSRDYFTREPGAIPVRTKEWPETVRFLAAEPAMEKAMHLLVAEGLTVEQAARRVGVHIRLLAGCCRPPTLSRPPGVCPRRHSARSLKPAKGGRLCRPPSMRSKLRRSLRWRYLRL